MREFIGFGGETPKEILDMLMANAVDTEIQNYTRFFDEDELKEKNEEFLNGSVEYEKLQDELDAVKKKYAGKMKPLKIENKTLLHQLKIKGEALKEEVYKMVDQEAKQVGYYSKDGKLIYERRIRKDEILQENLFKLPIPAPKADINNRIESKSGTDDLSFNSLGEEESPI